MIKRVFYVYFKEYQKTFPYETEIYNLNDLMFDGDYNWREYFSRCLDNISTYKRKHSKNHYSRVIVRNIIYTFFHLIFMDIIEKAAVFKFPGQLRMLLSISDRSFFKMKFDPRNPRNYGPLITLDMRFLKKAKNQYYICFGRRWMKLFYKNKGLGVKYTTVEQLKEIQ